MFTLVDLVWAEFWHRFPDLKFSLTEGDIGWIPYVLQRGEHIHDRHSGWTMYEFPDGMSPTAIFKRNIMCCFIKDRIGVKLIDEFNIDNVCWESDYPHSDSHWPNGAEALLPLFAGIDDSVINKITHENAIRNYRFDPFKARPKDKCTVAALRAEAPDVDTVTLVGRKADPSDRLAFMNIAARAGQPAAARS